MDLRRDSKEKHESRQGDTTEANCGIDKWAFAQINSSFEIKLAAIVTE
jgi:hypothetical protein